MNNDKLSTLSTFVMAVPYPEGAAIQLASFLHGSGELNKVFLPSARIAHATIKSARWIPALRPLSRRLDKGIAKLPLRQELLPSWELRRLAAAPFRRFGAHFDAEPFKQRFAKAVATAVLSGADTAPIVLAFPSASLEIFQVAGVRGVFHEVDGAPRERNRLLVEHFGPQARTEAVDGATIDRIEAELELASRILVPSNVVREGLARGGVRESRIVKIPYGVDLAEFAAMETTGQPNKRSRARVVFVGQISYRKGVPHLVAAAAKSTVDLVLVGPVVQSGLLKGLPPNVHYLGVRAHKDLPALFSTMDAFVLPSVEENFGLVVAEAAASGLPVIVASSVGAAESLTPRDAATFSPGDVDRLASLLGAVEPLDMSARAERADRVRRSEVFSSWDTYCSAVRSTLLGLQEADGDQW